MNTQISPQAYATLVCWFLFSMTWLWQRNRTKENINPRTTAQKISGFLGFVIIFLALYSPLFFTGGIAKVIIPQSHVVQTIGLICCIAGVFISIWSRFLLGMNWSGGITAKKDHKLIVSGPYRFVRHPIYTGFITALTGTCLVMGGIAGILVTGLYTIGLLTKINKEEVLLTELFGEVYTEYRQRTRKLIPFIW